jgi:hypothetical protein
MDGRARETEIRRLDHGDLAAGAGGVDGVPDFYAIVVTYK